MNSKRGRPARPRLNSKAAAAIAGALSGEAAVANVTLEEIGRRLCHSCRVETLNMGPQIPASCKHDPWRYDSRQWLWRALGEPGMTHDQARCILFRCEKLGALRPSTVSRLSRMVSRDEDAQAPVSGDKLIAIGLVPLRQAIDEVAAILREAMPGVAAGGKKERDFKELLAARFRRYTVDDSFGVR